MIAVILACIAVGALLPFEAEADPVEYELVFEGLWSPEHASLPFPGSAHFTTLIGATHADGAELWRPGEAATRGIEDVAELGSTGRLSDEIDDLIAMDLAGEEIRVAGIFDFPEEQSTTFSIDEDKPEVTLASMVAPSPDWFVGVYAVSLLDDEGEWVENLTIELRPWDAGTERGATFRLGNPASDPQGEIRRRVVPFIDDPVIGRLHFTLLPEPGAAGSLLAALLGLAASSRLARATRD